MNHPDAAALPATPDRPAAHALPGVRHVLAVSSGKGGVGKSTTAMNLAAAMARAGWQVGLLDADIHGPSAPTMLGASTRPQVRDEGRTLLPVQAHGIRLMSVGLLMAQDAPLIWRGAAASQMLEQMLRQTQWGEIDVLVIDMPPGTGDVPLSLCQRAPLSGALIVTTPQDVALLDVMRGVRMFEKARVPVLGVVENMAVHTCSACGHVSHPFGTGGGERLQADTGVPLLVRLPLSLQVRLQADAGVPIVCADPQGVVSHRYRLLAQEVMARLTASASAAEVASPLRIDISADT